MSFLNKISMDFEYTFIEKIIILNLPFYIGIEIFIINHLRLMINYEGISKIDFHYLRNLAVVAPSNTL